LSQGRCDAPEDMSIGHRVKSEVEIPEMWFGQGPRVKIDRFSFVLILFEIVTDLSTLGSTVTSEGLRKWLVNALTFRDFLHSLSLY
jgi:hypothetical protein